MKNIFKSILNILVFLYYLIILSGMLMVQSIWVSLVSVIYSVIDKTDFIDEISKNFVYTLKFDYEVFNAIFGDEEESE